MLIHNTRQCLCSKVKLLTDSAYYSILVKPSKPPIHSAEEVITLVRCSHCKRNPAVDIEPCCGAPDCEWVIYLCSRCSSADPEWWLGEERVAREYERRLAMRHS
jgi:hypothetical protein